MLRCICVKCYVSILKHPENNHLFNINKAHDNVLTLRPHTFTPASLSFFQNSL